MIGDKYKYINSNTPEEKIDYSYSKYNGEDFMQVWEESRQKYINYEEIPVIKNIAKENTCSESLFYSWIKNFKDGNHADLEEINLLLKRFEVTRKIYKKYNSKFRPLDKTTDFNEINLYILFSCVLVNAYLNTKKLYYLNSLLKVNDIILSNKDAINKEYINLFNYCISKEVEFIKNLRRELE